MKLIICLTRFSQSSVEILLNFFVFEKKFKNLFQISKLQSLGMGGCCESRQLELTNNKYLSTCTTSFSQEPQVRRIYIHAVLSGIQDQSRKNREERLKVYSKHSKSNDSTYISLIQRSIEKEKLKIAELLQNLTTQFGSLQLLEKELYSDMVSYLQLRGITQNEVKDWILEKTKIVKLNGKELASKIKTASRSVNQNISKVQIFQTMIEDKCITDKGFLLSVASQFIYTNHLSEKQKWISGLADIQKEVNFMKT